MSSATLARKPAGKVGRMVPHFSTYLAQIGAQPLLSRSEERELADRIADGDREARDCLVRANLRLVVHLAQSFKERGISMDDLIAEGNLGLLHAVELFDPSANTRFATYASYWIKQAMWNAIKSMRNTIRLPAYAFSMVSRWKQMTAQLEVKLRRPPTQEEIAAGLRFKPKQVDLITKALRILGTFGAGEDKEDHDAREGVLMDRQGSTPDAGLEQEEETSRLRRFLDDLDEREATILRLRFGFNGEEPLNLSEIGERVQLTRERVRQIAKRALAVLGRRLDGSGNS